MNGIVLLLVLAGQAEAEPARKVKTLVLDVDAPTLSGAGLVKVLTETVVSVYSADEGREVISQSELTEVLDLEQQKQAAGCDAVSCLAEVAQALDADTLVRVSIAAVGEQYVLSMNEFSAETVKPVARMQSRCEKDDVALLSAIEQLATKLLQSSSGEVQFFGTLRVKTAPSGGVVFVDGQRAGVSPVEKSVPIGSHRVEVRHEGETIAFDTEVRRKLVTDVDMQLRHREPPPPEVLEAYEDASFARPFWLGGEFCGGSLGLVCGGCAGIFGSLSLWQTSTLRPTTPDEQFAQTFGFIMWGGFAAFGVLAAALGASGLGYGVYDMGFGAPVEPEPAPPVHIIKTSIDGEKPRLLRLEVDASQRH